MDRREILARIGCAIAFPSTPGCLTGTSPSENRPGDTNRSDGPNGNRRTTDGNRSAITITETRADGPYTIGPSHPNCPGHAEDADNHWGQMFTTTDRIDESIGGPEEAGELLLTVEGHTGAVEVATPRVDTIEWMGETYNITEESTTGEWYVLRPDTHRDVTVLAIPQSDETTVLREYVVGDC